MCSEAEVAVAIIITSLQFLSLCTNSIFDGFYRLGNRSSVAHAFAAPVGGHGGIRRCARSRRGPARGHRHASFHGSDHGQHVVAYRLLCGCASVIKARLVIITYTDEASLPTRTKQHFLDSVLSNIATVSTSSSQQRLTQ